MSSSSRPTKELSGKRIRRMLRSPWSICLCAMNASSQNRSSCSTRLGECCECRRTVWKLVALWLPVQSLSCFDSTESSPSRQRASRSNSQRTWSVWSGSRRLCTVRLSCPAPLKVLSFCLMPYNILPTTNVTQIMISPKNVALHWTTSPALLE